MKQSFLQLAHVYEPAKHFITGWFASEKLDGIRCFWDAGVSRGLPCTEIPWANTRKHDRFVQIPRSTGLWSRYCQPIQAPAWFLDTLPKILLDGELTMGRGKWQETSSCVRSLVPDARWRNIKYWVFDSPPPAMVFADRIINEANSKIKMKGAYEFWESKRTNQEMGTLAETPFYKVIGEFFRRTDWPNHCQWLPQDKVPSGGQEAAKYLEQQLAEIEAGGGEGLILRSPISAWKPERGKWVLKVKSMQDAEGIVIGYKWAKPTDLDKSVSGQATNKLLGLMGSLRVRMDNGIEFDLSGFTDAERKMTDTTPDGSDASAKLEGIRCPGEVADLKYENPTFPRYSRISFKFRELSSDGVPKEARFWRKP